MNISFLFAFLFSRAVCNNMQQLLSKEEPIEELHSSTDDNNEEPIALHSSSGSIVSTMHMPLASEISSQDLQIKIHFN